MRFLELEKQIHENYMIYGNGVIFDNKKVVVSWEGDIKTIVIYESFEDLISISQNCSFKYKDLIYKD